jgi:hypothetical protein
MSVLLITYDLNKPGQDYKDLLDYIKRFPWAKLSESSYAIETNMTPIQVYNAIKGMVDTNDNVYIVTLTVPWYGQGRPEVNQWLSGCLSQVHQY